MRKWTQREAIDLACEVEKVAPKYGYHVALTGGCLYKGGERKDCDLIFYRIRQVDEPDTNGMFDALEDIGLCKTGGFGWCHKALYDAKSVDCLFPEECGGTYVAEEDFV
jgi:hypothetical protein